MVPSAAKEKIPSDTTGNRSRDRPTSSAVLVIVIVKVVVIVVAAAGMYQDHRHDFLYL